LASLLDAADLKQVLAELSLRAQQDLEKKSTRDADMWATAVYEALTAAFGHGDGAGLGPLVVKRVVSAPTAWKPVHAFMESSGLAKLTVPKRLAMYRMLATMAVKRSREIAANTGVPVTPKFVASVSANLGPIFDLEFPGYLAAGLAPMVAGRLAHI